MPNWLPSFHLPRQRRPEDDANIKALIDPKRRSCTYFGKSWTLHVTESVADHTGRNLRIIEQSVGYLRAQTGA